MMKKKKSISKNLHFILKPAVFLVTFILLLSFVNSTYVHARNDSEERLAPATHDFNNRCSLQETKSSQKNKIAAHSSTEDENIEDIVIPKKMKSVQSKITRLEKRVIKKPDDIIAREELIRLRKRHYKMFDSCIEEAETLPGDKFNDKQRCEIKIKLLEKKKECALKIKEDYNQLSDGQEKYFADLRTRALKGSAGFEGNLRYMKTYDIERVVYELVKNDGMHNTQRVIKEIRKERERLLRENKDSIEKYQDEVMKVETRLYRVRDDCKE
ncbi:hypothetical protein ACFLRB_01600 [Acidobacteriota bacterium]